MTGDSRDVTDTFHRTLTEVAEARRAVAHGDHAHRNARIEAFAELYEQEIAERQAHNGVGRD